MVLKGPSFALSRTFRSGLSPGGCCKHGEPGLVRHLAARDQVPVSSLEPARDVEAAYLIGQFGKFRVGRGRSACQVLNARASSHKSTAAQLFQQ